MLSPKEGMRDENPFEFDKEFLEAFMSLKSMVEEIYVEWKKSKGVGGGDPPKPLASSYFASATNHESCMSNVSFLKGVNINGFS